MGFMGFILGGRGGFFFTIVAVGSVGSFLLWCGGLYLDWWQQQWVIFW